MLLELEFSLMVGSLTCVEGIVYGARQPLPPSFDVYEDRLNGCGNSPNPDRLFQSWDGKRFERSCAATIESYNASLKTASTSSPYTIARGAWRKPTSNSPTTASEDEQSKDQQHAA